jgi:hypothetical protein
MFPPLAKMRAVVERMRNLSDVIAVRANSSGRLQLSASTEVVNADITWTNCSHPRIGQSDSLVALLFCICFTVHPHTSFFLQLRMAHLRPMGAMMMSRNVNDLTQTSSSACLFTLEAS